MLRDLFNQELRISEIARRTGYSSGTVRKCRLSTVPYAPQKRQKKPSKLDDYKEYIASRLQEYPLPAKRIYREIQEKGFTGKYTIIKDFVREVRPRTSVAAVYRHETKPGIQSQVDIVASIFDALKIGEVIHGAMPKQGSKNLPHSTIIKAMILNGLGFTHQRLYLFPNYLMTIPTEVAHLVFCKMV